MVHLKKISSTCTILQYIIYHTQYGSKFLNTSNGSLLPPRSPPIHPLQAHILQQSWHQETKYQEKKNPVDLLPQSEPFHYNNRNTMLINNFVSRDDYSFARHHADTMQRGLPLSEPWLHSLTSGICVSGLCPVQLLLSQSYSNSTPPAMIISSQLNSLPNQTKAKPTYRSQPIHTCA